MALPLAGLRVSGSAPSTPATGSEPGDDAAFEIPGMSTRQSSQEPAGRDGQEKGVPTLSHRLRHNSSILAIVLSDRYIYAGTQRGEILVYCLRSYERHALIWGHRGSVLGLYLSPDQTLLLSSAGDRLVNVWNTHDLSRSCCIYSPYDVGDVFCVAYSATLRSVYFGAQNTTIQWCSQDQRSASTGARRQSNLAMRSDPFFDSRGPGGVATPKPADSNIIPKDAKGGEVLEVGRESVRHFAHYGYVYCMLLTTGLPEALGKEVLISGGGDGNVKVWKLDEDRGGAIEELYNLDDGREEGHSILTMAIDGTFLYTGRNGGEINVWDLETRQLVRNIKAHRDDVLTLSIGAGFLLSGSVTGYIRKFDKQHQLIARLKAHSGRTLASAFGYEKERPIYVTGGSDDTLAVWDVSNCVSMPTSHYKTSNEQLTDSLRRFVSYRTVSSDARHAVDCRRGASYLRSVFKNFGASTEMLSAPDPYNPIILARFKGNPATAARRKKILFYGHYDVVAANNASGKWIVDPFAMEGIDGYLYGRGTSDNKGPIMAAVFACAELMRERNLGSDIIFLIEGEEENGSRGFEKAVRANKDKIGHVDWILLANSYWLDDRIPCLTYGLRGVIHAKVRIESSQPDLHSGVDGSAQLDEPLKDLVMLLNALTGRNGIVKIPGFYDPIPPISAEEQGLYNDITNALVQCNPDLGDPDALATSLVRRWREASLTIHRFQTSGPDNATIIPRKAKVAISMRLVPNQESGQVSQSLISHLHSKFRDLESSNELTVTIDHQAEPWLGDWTNDMYQTLEEAIIEAWGPLHKVQNRNRRTSTMPAPANGTGNSRDYSSMKPSPATSSFLAKGSAASPLPPATPMSEMTKQQASVVQSGISKAATRPNPLATLSVDGTDEQCKKPLYIREGGSIPAIRFLEKEFSAPAAHFPCGQASDSAHLDNERLRLLNLYKSRDIFKKVFRELPMK